MVRNVRLESRGVFQVSSRPSFRGDRLLVGRSVSLAALGPWGGHRRQSVDINSPSCPLSERWCEPVEFLVHADRRRLTGHGRALNPRRGLSRGSRASIVAAFGCTIGIVPHMAATILGLAAVMYTSALAFETVKYLGVAYLVYMAWNALREEGPLKVDTDGSPRSARQVIVSGILVNVLNPKLSIFFLAFLPQFVNPANRTGSSA